MQQAEVCLLAEVWLQELGMTRMLSNQLLDQRFVRRFRKPTFFVDNRQKTNRLNTMHTTVLTDIVNNSVTSFATERTSK